MNDSWHLYLMASFYIIAGLLHLMRPKIYRRIIPRCLPYPRALVLLSGLAEIILGIAICFPAWRTQAVYGIILMLMLFLPVHFYMLSSPKAGAGIPVWALILRIPLQFILMYWAYLYL